jgi:DNA-binding GntR family transcriptional regulator
MLNIERPKSLSEEVAAQLRREIVDGTFEMGEALSESMIAARYGVSRTPVREAFAFLGQEGLVRTEPQQGTYVFKISRGKIQPAERDTRPFLRPALSSWRFSETGGRCSRGGHGSRRR